MTMLISCSGSVLDGASSTEDELRIVGTVGEYEVCYDELYYLIMACSSIMANKYGEDIWETEESAAKYENELRKNVLERITSNYAVLLLCEEYGIKNVLSDRDAIKYVNKQIDSVLYAIAISNGIEVTFKESASGKVKYNYTGDGLQRTNEIFDKMLAEEHLTERVMRLTLGVEFAFEQLSRTLTGEKGEIIFSAEDIEDYMFSDKFIATRHIFIQNDKGDSIDDNRRIAEDLLAQYKNGEPMDKLLGSKYNEDVSMTSYLGYYFTYGEMDKTYEDAAFALSVGEVSDVVETEDGFFIIERLEKSSTYMLGNLEEFANQITYALINQKVRSFQDTLSLTLSEFGSSVEFYKIPVNEVASDEKTDK
jgi:parvulin-like peptidyl-prolyl isomerase